MTTQQPLTTRDDLQLPQVDPREGAVVGWLRDFVRMLKASFRLHAHLFPAVLSGELKPKSYTTATKPTAAKAGASAIIFVSDGGAGANFQGSDGTNWLNLG